ncbi:hypothetical protein CFBP8129_28830 [Xanthomonas hortorum pv. gardneri]|uniref:Uncharacterized protein n=1 Tax=Xanthomonas hortorum pv. gardneri TaxID=2754056 RepID=A0A6V7DY01_9XANT|nr:hypothetical protein CFBP2044_28410 [Xanthomonas hortorum pv. cynarae]CAD0342031.1 hypothetical protein CFBP2044_28410 [Xanthomonas hortorum pv. cynarae]CAD0342711.1 hypothetical protein CFBP8129_28830 [Xanthomonas hortorum pv. gardneri]CAD0342719.1 hypothetical protein CFBP8129_28830 [Xanthomonas hortorum pv. gardneri]
MARSEADQSTRRRSLSYSHRQQPVVLACVPAWDLMRHGMLQKSLQRCTCGVSHAGTRASTLSNRAFRTKPADFMCAVDRSAVPYPVSGHAVNPSVEARWRHPCRHTVLQAVRPSRLPTLSWTDGNHKAGRTRLTVNVVGSVSDTKRRPAYSKLPTESCARLSKRVYSPKNLSLHEPVGPPRCLPMMISARPLSGEFSLL